MPLSGNFYFSLTNGSLQVKPWDPGVNKALVSCFATGGQVELVTLAISLFVYVATLLFPTPKKSILDVGCLSGVVVSLHLVRMPLTWRGVGLPIL